MTVEPTATHAPKGREAPPQPEGETGSSQSFHWHWSCRRDHLVSRDHPGLLFRSDFGIFVNRGRGVTLATVRRQGSGHAHARLWRSPSLRNSKQEQAASHRRRVRDHARVAQGRGRRWRLQGIIPWLSDARVAEGHNEVEEGLPDQGPRPAQDHDARRRRVHPPLSPARAAQRLPPHPTLRPVRQRRSGAQHRARPPSARRAQDPARQRASRSRQRDRNTFVCAPMPVLRRPHDHRRDVRRSAPWALTAAEPDQDRHLMIIAALPASQRRFPSPPPARRTRKLMSSRGRQSFCDRCDRATPAHLATELARPRRFPRQDCEPPARTAAQASHPPTRETARPTSPSGHNVSAR